MADERRFYTTCAALLVTVPVAILLIGFIESVAGRVVAILVMAGSVLLMRKYPIPMTGDLYELEKGLSEKKKLIVLTVILAGAMAGVWLSLKLGFFLI
ncbi:MAG: hypothetical protein HY516_00365 [Candidatus Aenigmarchaeota archaeon]|nr:hypothetical protein [Candidatus Aenigmarchaeota archaeon]